MKNISNLANQTRREFLQKISIIGSTAYLGIGGIFTLARAQKNKPGLAGDFQYKYKTISVQHIEEVKKWFDKLKNEERIGKNKTYRGYLEGFKFNPEEILPGAKSIVIISVREKVASVIFNFKGKKVQILIPVGYVDDGLTFASLKARIMKDVIKDPAKKLQEQIHLPLKTLAVRSGLADYGKNNITFVDEYGSFHSLYGLYTDKELPDNWRPLNMLRLCKGCSICKNDCPTKCIRDENFVIDIDHCVTLYNELEEPIPEWIPPEAHNALVGCLKCQDTCPANEIRIKELNKLAEISEAETDFLLGDKTDDQMHKRIAEKLVRFPAVNNLNYFRRNFKLVFANVVQA